MAGGGGMFVYRDVSPTQKTYLLYVYIMVQNEILVAHVNTSAYIYINTIYIHIHTKITSLNCITDYIHPMRPITLPR